MLFQPLGEEILQLVRQAQQDIRRITCTCLFGRLQQPLHFTVSKYRNDRRKKRRHRYPRLAQTPDRLQPTLGSGCARLESARQIPIQRGEGDRHVHQIALGHRGQDIQVALDQRRLGDDGNGMIGLTQHLQALAGDAELFLRRLIGIGIDTDRHRRTGVTAPAQLLAQ